MNKEVVVYGRSEPYCSFCESAKNALDAVGIEYDYKDIVNEEVMQEFQLLGVRSVPQVLVEGVNKGGADCIQETIKGILDKPVKSLLTVIKRNGEEVTFDETKLNKWGQWASNSNVPWSDVVFQAFRLLSDKCTTNDIQETLIKVCVDKGDIKHLDMAARLLVGKVYKQVFGTFESIPDLPTFYDKMVQDGHWTDMGYSVEDLELLDEVINHNKDFDYKYSTVKQITDKYAVQDRKNNKVYESPQFMYMGVALANMQKMPEDRKIEDVSKLYIHLSDLKINAPTPTLSGLRTKSRGLASCCLFTTLDTADSIGVGSHIAYSATNMNAGVGGYVHTRSLGDGVRDGSIIHTGKLPYYRLYEASVKSTKQANRGGALTTYYSILDPEIETLLRLKHVTTPAEKQIRGMDYGCMINTLFVKKALKNEDWMLVSANDAPDLWAAFFTSKDNPLFEELYNRYLLSDVPKTMVSARKLALTMEAQWYETGRVYKLWVDEVNKHTPFKSSIFSSNLCNEIMLPTSGYEGTQQLYNTTDVTSGSGEIALCFLSSLVAGRIKTDEYEEVAYYATLMIDNTMEIMDYPFPQMEVTAKARRSIGVGITNLADHMAVNGRSYTSNSGKKFIHDHAEMHSFYLHKASLRLAKERGVAEWIGDTKYPEGWLPIDTYNKNVDSLVTGLNFDWEGLRKEIIEVGGIRNSVLEATPPTESSSQASNTTNSIYPARQLMIVKGKVPCYVPHYEDEVIRDNYESAWDLPFKDMVDMYSLVQKFHGQGISADFWFNPDKYTDRKVGTKEQLQNLAYATKMGLKGAYYMSTRSSDGLSEEKETVCDSGGCDV